MHRKASQPSRAPSGDDPGDMRQERFDISAAERDLGYRPNISLEEGIRSYLDWLKARENEQ